MKVVILAGGLGTRFSEETALKPKPMIEIGGMPILWHIMKFYAAHGLSDFVVCAGYRQDVIKHFFANYHLYRSAATTFEVQSNAVRVHETAAEDWRVTVVDTGENTMTAGRIQRARPWIGNEAFCLTYGDGLSNIDITALVAHHKKAGKVMTLSAVTPPARFGTLQIEGGVVRNFVEKSSESERLVNGGFMVCDPRVFDYLGNDESMPLEKAPMERIAAEGQLAAYEHRGFWQCMDKQHDKQYLENLWHSGQAPWKAWE
jgi:glucose-1-phosphate cytidylyltransferase